MGAAESTMFNENKLKLGFFSPNCSSGMAVTRAPERWENSWDNNIALAQLADTYRAKSAVKQADVAYQRALQVAEQCHMQPLIAHCHEGLGEVATLENDVQKASGHLQRAATMFAGIGMTHRCDRIGSAHGI